MRASRPNRHPLRGAPRALDQASGGGGLRALLAVRVTRARLARLAALPESVLVAARPAASFPAAGASGRPSEPSAMSAWPAGVRDLGVPLCERGLPVHCLPDTFALLIPITAGVLLNCLPHYVSWLLDNTAAASGLAAVSTTPR